MRQVRAIQSSGPYNFAGHSSGGLVVFEMACQLKEAGETVGLLALLDCDPDTGKLSHRPFRDWDSLKASFRRARVELDLKKFGARDLLRRRIDYQKMKDQEPGWRHDRGVAGQSGTTWLALKGTSHSLCGDYELRPYPGNVTLFIAEDMKPGSPQPRATRAWMGKVLGSCEALPIPGTHRNHLEAATSYFACKGNQTETARKCGGRREKRDGLSSSTDEHRDQMPSVSGIGVYLSVG